jgi:hypothetical protein
MSLLFMGGLGQHLNFCYHVIIPWGFESHGMAQVLQQGDKWIDLITSGCVSVSHTCVVKPQLKQSHKAGHWWLMPIIIAAWKAEIRKIVFPGLLGDKSLCVPMSMGKSWLVGHSCNPSNDRKLKIGG